MTALYQLADAYREAMALLEETEGEITPEIEAALDAAGGAFVEKVDAVAAMVRMHEADAERFAEEERFFARKRAAAEARARWLKDYLRRALESAGEKKVKGERFTVAIHASPPSVALLVDDPQQLPEVFRRVRVEVDKSAIKAALEAGQELEFAELRRSNHVRIR